ncbi:IclR family transcriptional regulator [Halomarina halobia]|uniref:IclR family transcriptional regulator n=1 Tax=Halomarina halobia TaxID=3033386 RepID=A0ABD6ACP4_9EURY|nr:IclR family transcriptional regulator [Halomarina sp. PSR21]
MVTEEPGERVATVHTAFEIVSYVQESRGARLTDVAAHLDIAKSTAHRHIRYLESQGYLVETDGEYHVGLRFLDHGIHARERIEWIELAETRTATLADETGELCNFMVEQNGWCYILCREKGPSAVETGSRIGKPLYLHTTAGGKAILSCLPERRVRRIVRQRGLPKHTETTVEDTDQLLADLATVRERGYAVNDEEHIPGLMALGAPVIGAGDVVLGALCISGPSNRLGDRRTADLAQQLLGAVNELELNIKYTRPHR